MHRFAWNEIVYILRGDCDWPYLTASLSLGSSHTGQTNVSSGSTSSSGSDRSITARSSLESVEKLSQEQFKRAAEAACFRWESPFKGNKCNKVHLPNHQEDQGNHDLLWHQADQSIPGIPEDHRFQQYQEDPKQPQDACQWTEVRQLCICLNITSKVAIICK